MKLAKTILAGAIAVAGISTARADVTVYITGATAYRSAATVAIENLFNNSFACVYGAKSGVTSETNATHAAFRGTVPSQPGLGVVTVKVAWAGSVGGLKIVANPALNINSQPGVSGWIPDSNIPVTNQTVGTLETSITFESGASAAKADAAFSDAFQASAGVSGLIGCPTADTTNGKVGVVPFEWVVNNGVTNVAVISISAYGVGAGTAGTPINYTNIANAPLAVGQAIGGKGIPIGATIVSFTGTGAIGSSGTIEISAPTTATSDAGNTITSGTATSAPISNVQALLARSLLTSGAVYLSQFTGNAADNKPVWFFGRNADSGTRISYLAETGRGVTQQPQQIQPSITGGSANGAGGLPSRKIASLYRWPADTSLFPITGVNYTVGQSGYASGGTLADAMTAFGSLQNTSTTGGTAPALSAALGNGGWIISYLGRGDAARACATTFGLNTAKRLTWNGEKDWFGTSFGIDGRPNVNGTAAASYDDASIQEGRYTAWEFEHFYRKDSTSADATTYLTALADGIGAFDPGVDSIPLTSMHVSRAIEGAIVTHN